jgi:RND superfamily putative drug exporter
LAIAVVLDATLVRLVLLPAALKLVGRWAWWTPRLTLGEPVLRAVHPAVEQAGG